MIIPEEVKEFIKKCVAEEAKYQLKETQETLNNKILALDGKELTVTLPEEFRTATEIYNFQVNEDRVLFSADVSGIGVWVYTISDDSWEQLSTYLSRWKTFQLMKDKCLLGSSTDVKNLLIYDLLENKINSIMIVPASYYNDRTENMVVVGDKCLISGSGGSRTYVYNSLDGSVKTIVNTKSTRNKATKMGDKYLIHGGSDTGIWLFNPSDDTVNVIYSSGAYWTNSKVVGNKCLISSGSSGYLGILVYNSVDENISLKYSSGKMWSSFTIVGDKCLISSTDTNTNSNANSKGVLLYNPIDDTFEKKYSDGYSWTFRTIVDNKLLLSSNVANNAGILVYDATTETVEKKYTSGYSWKYNYVIGDVCLLSSDQSSGLGLLLYKSQDNTITQIYKTLYGFDTFINDGANCYVESSNKKINKQKIYFNSADQTVKLVGYYIGEV